MSDTILVKAIETGGIATALLILLVMTLRFLFERLKSWGIFATQIAMESVEALKQMQNLASESAKAQQAFTDTIQELATTIRDLANIVTASSIETTKEHQSIRSEVSSLKSALGKQPR